MVLRLDMNLKNTYFDSDLTAEKDMPAGGFVWKLLFKRANCWLLNASQIWIPRGWRAAAAGRQFCKKEHLFNDKTADEIWEKICEQVVCVKEQEGATGNCVSILTIKGGERARMWRESSPRQFFKPCSSPQDQKPKVTSKWQISLSSLNFVCWISNCSGIGILLYAFSAEWCVFFPSVFLVCGKSQGRCPRTLDPARGLLLSWPFVTRPHLPAQFFSGKNTCLLCLWTFKRKGCLYFNDFGLIFPTAVLLLSFKNCRAQNMGLFIGLSNEKCPCEETEREKAGLRHEDHTKPFHHSRAGASR